MFLRKSNLTYLFATLALVICGQVSAQEKKPEKITYDDHVKPILQQKCFSCHRPDKKSSDLDLTTYSTLMAGGASGASVEPGDSSGSYLYQLVTHESEPVMPPEQPKIADEMIETIRKWIDGGLLENSGSKAKTSDKKKFDMALSTAPTERPEVIPVPGRLSLQPIIRTEATTAIDALATSPWAPLAAVGGQKQVLLYNTQSLELVGTLAFPEGTPRVLKFSRNGSLLLAGGGVAGASGRVVVWNVRNGQRIIEIGDELDEVLAADISSDQTLIALGGPLKVVRIYSTESGRLMHEIKKHTDWITSLEFSPDSVLLATGDRNGGMFVWEAWTGREYLTLNGHTNGITEVSWRSDSSIVASSSEDTTVKLWEMENGAAVKSWAAHGTGTLSVEFTRDGRLLTSGRDNVPRLWDQNGGKQRDFEAFADLATRVSYCDETNRAIAGDWTGEIRVFNSADGVRAGNISANAPMLEERLAQSNQLLIAKQTEHKPLADAFNLAQAELDKIRVEYSASQKAVADSKQVADASAAALVAASQLVAKATAERDAVNKALGEMNASVPLLNDAAAKALVAASKVAEDKELAGAAEKIKQVADAKAAELIAIQAMSQEKTAAFEKAQLEMTNAQKLASESAATLAAMQKKEQELLPLVKPAEEKHAAAKASYDVAVAALTSAQQEVARWTDEIAFSKQFAELNAQRAAAIQSLSEHETAHGEAEAVVSEAEAALATAMASLTQAQNDLVTHKQNYQSAIAAAEAAKQVLAAATKATVDVTASNTLLTQLITVLSEANAKAAEAATIAKDDKAVIDATASFNALLAAKVEQLKAGEADLLAKMKAEEDAKVDLANKEKATVDTLAIQDATSKRVADLTAANVPIAQKVSDARKATEVTAKAVADAQQAIEVVQKAIAVAQGLEPSA